MTSHAEQVKAIKAALKDRGHTVNSACERAGIYPSTLYDFFKKSSSDLNFSTIRKLANTLDITAGQLIGETALPSQDVRPVYHLYGEILGITVSEFYADLVAATRRTDEIAAAANDICESHPYYRMQEKTRFDLKTGSDGSLPCIYDREAHDYAVCTEKETPKTETSS